MNEFATYILFGDFGFFTMTPVFLLTVLFPAITTFSLLSLLMQRFFKLKNSSLSLLLGFGCTSAALATLKCKNEKERFRLSAILCELIPCSAQTAIIIPFLFLLDLEYIIFYFATILLTVIIFLKFLQNPLPQNINILQRPLFNAQIYFNYTSLNMGIFVDILKTAVRNGLGFVKESFVPFAVGSIAISILSWLGFFEKLCVIAAPFTEGFLKLPKEAANIFVLSLLKRDLGAASFLSIIKTSCFSQGQLTVTLIILSLFVPCFASTVILIKQEGLFKAFLLWILILFLAFSVGKISSLFLC